MGGYSHIELEAKSNTARISAIAILTALLLGGGCVYYLWDSGETRESIAIDGDFDDWLGKEGTSDAIGDTLNPNIDIINTTVAADSTFMSFLIETKEPMFFAPQTVRILIDSDNEQNTGYFTQEWELIT